MTTEKRLGIWMDHSTAHLMEFLPEYIASANIDSKFTHTEKGKTLQKSENAMHNKENHQQAEYYKKLGEVVVKYEDVLLFGPTDAKTELFNILKADHRFEGIKIEVQQTDKLWEKEQHAFVKAYFKKR